MRPDLGQVERVEPVRRRVLERHDLHLEPPLRRIARGDRVPQVTTEEVGVLGHHRVRLGQGEVLDALDGLEVVLDPEPLAGRVHPRVGVAAVAVHVPVAAGRAAVGHQDRDLVGGLRRQRPEVPLHVVRPQACVGHALLRADEVLELDRVAHEERRRVVANEVVVPLVGVELEREATWVADRVRAPELARDLREAREHRRALPNLGQEARVRPLAHVLRDLEEPVRAAALRVNDPLGDALAVEVLHLLNQMSVVQDGRSVRPDGQRMVIARDRDAGVVRGGRGTPIAHWEPLGRSSVQDSGGQAASISASQVRL